MSRLTLSPFARVRDLERVARMDAYAEHRLLWGFFPGGDSQRRFLFRRVEARRRPAFLVVSREEPVSPSPAWIVETKPYEPRLEPGQRLAFSLRANPVVSRRSEDGRQQRHDVVMDAKTSLRREHPGEPAPMGELIQTAGSAWLAARAERFGFSLEHWAVRCDGYRQHRIVRRGSVVYFSSLDFEGILEVTDSARFSRTLYEGIGPEKAFGCGLLLVRRARAGV